MWRRSCAASPSCRPPQTQAERARPGTAQARGAQNPDSGFLFPAAAAALAPPEPGRISALIHAHGSMQLRWYAPRGTDAQAPHAQDELSTVVTGQGHFRRGEERLPFGPGDAIFLPAQTPHRFEDFSEDLGVRVVFCGPEGGEAA